MKTRNAIVGAIAVVAMSTVLGTTQANAASGQFTFSSIFLDNTITSGTSTLTIQNGGTNSNTGTPTAIVLSNISEFTTPGTGPNTFAASPYTTTVTINDIATGTSISHNFTGTFTGSAFGGDAAGNGKTSFFLDTPTVSSQQYVFADGTYTVTRSSFVSPGAGGVADGSQGAVVTFTPARLATPEPGSMIAFLAGGSLLALMAFRRRSAFKPAA